jgi:hypothetical protein
VQARAQLPETQYGAVDVQSALDAQLDDAFGSQTDFVQVKPAAQVFEGPHGGRHWPFAQTLLPAHWLEKVQTAVAGWQAPATHESPAAQSAAVVHLQGPFVPPHTGAASTATFASPASDVAFPSGAASGAASA